MLDWGFIRDQDGRRESRDLEETSANIREQRCRFWDDSRVEEGYT